MRCPKCRAENAGGALYCKMRGASMGGCEGRGAPGPSAETAMAPEPAPGAVFAAADADSAATFSYPLAEGAADFARYQRQLADKAEQVKTAREAAALAAADFEMYRRRRRNCVIAGAVLVLLLALSFPSWIESYGANTGDDPLYSLALNVAVFSLGAANTFFFPFGFTPIKNFIANSGFFIVAGWLFLMLAASILVLLFMLLGIPYAIWLTLKVRKSRRSAEEAVGFAQKLELEYRSM